MVKTHVEKERDAYVLFDPLIISLRKINIIFDNHKIKQKTNDTDTWFKKNKKLNLKI